MKTPSSSGFANGYNVQVRVRRGHLEVESGVGADRRVARFNRVTGRLQRLVVVASSGSISLAAIAWMADTRCALIHLDHTGRLLTTSATHTPHQPALRRAQARAVDRKVGVEITRRLLATKILGQAEVARTLDQDISDRVFEHAARLEACSTLIELRLVEAQAASAYWSAWRGVTPSFATRDLPRIPEHWTRFDQRVSPLTGSPRSAVNPVCAAMNLLHSLVEAEARIALMSLGLDAATGILHTDQTARDSAALDLVEVCRPAVDAFLLRLIAERPFSLHDIHETRTGECRLLPPLVRELAETAPAWAGQLAPHAEMTAQLLAADTGLPRPATRLTQAERRAARPDWHRKRPRPSSPPPLGARCTECGTPLRVGQKRCPECHRSANAERMREEQRAGIAKRRSAGRHPSQDPTIRKAIAETQRGHWQARQAVHAPASGFTGHPSEFRRLIQPRLAGRRPSDLARATGLSPGYCAQVRDGQRVPHVRHWAAFQLAGFATPPTA